MPDPDLIKYFDAANLKHHFLDEDYLNSFKDKEHMREFFKKLGIADEVSYCEERMHYDPYNSWYNYKPYEPPHYTKRDGLDFIETEFEGLKEISEAIVKC